ncbi:hypothetical protein ACWC5O_03695 [Streptomyces sp. NPDC001450]
MTRRADRCCSARRSPASSRARGPVLSWFLSDAPRAPVGAGPADRPLGADLDRARLELLRLSPVRGIARLCAHRRRDAYEWYEFVWWIPSDTRED